MPILQASAHYSEHTSSILSLCHVVLQTSHSLDRFEITIPHENYAKLVIGLQVSCGSLNLRVNRSVKMSSHKCIAVACPG